MRRATTFPAAWDFFRTGSLIPTTTLTNAHPPLPSVYLALWWKASGFYPEVTREAVLIIAALGLLAVWQLVLRIHGSRLVAFWTVMLTGLYPIWFAQSTLAHGDIFAAAFALWGLVYALPDRDRNPRAAALWFMAAALSKETAIAIPLTLAIARAIEGFRTPAAGAAALCGAKPRGSRAASCPWPPGTAGTSPRPGTSSAIRISCATTRRPRWRPIASPPLSCIASCT